MPTGRKEHQAKEAEKELGKLKKELVGIQDQIKDQYSTKSQHINKKKGEPTRGWLKKLNDLKEEETRIGNAIGEINARLSSLGKLTNS